MNESLPSLAPSNRTVQVLTIAALVLVIAEPAIPVSTQLIALAALLAATLAWVYTAPLRWPSVAFLVATVPLLLWPAQPFGQLCVLISASFVLVRSFIPTPDTTKLGGKREHARGRYRSLAIATTAGLAVVTLLGNVGAMSCTTFPFCGENGIISQLQNSHRIFSVIAAIFTALLVVQTVRSYPTQASRGFAYALGALVLAQVVAGIFVTTSVLSAVVHAVLSALSIISAGVLVGLAYHLPWTLMTIEAPAVAAESDDIVGPYTWKEKVKDYVSLTKPGVISLLILTTITSMYITPAGKPELALVIWTTIGGWLMAAASHAYNCYLDRDIDVLMGRTGRRPIPSGRIPGWHALVLGSVLMILAAVILVVYANWLTAALAFAGLVYYVLIYTMWLKRSSVQNIVIGGGAGAFPPLVGWAAATGSLTLPSLFLFAIIFYWTPPHFWALAIIRSKDYARAGIPMLPVIAGDNETRWQIVLYTMLMFVVTIMPTPLQMLGMAYLVMASVLGVIFSYYAINLYRQGTTASAWGLYRFSLLYLALLFGAMVVDRVYFS
jgi:protoheme IX farnesyltransferase